MMERLIDLHTHSQKSDGSMTPKELVNHAKKSGLSAIALTDHDSIDGVFEAVDEGKRIGIEVINGIEFSVKSDTETHILGYDIDINNKELTDALFEVKNVRKQRNQKTSENLKKIGFDISVKEVQKIAPNGIIGRAHFAKMMVIKGYVSSVKEAFDLYLSNGKPGYCSNQLLTCNDAIKLIKNANGKSFVAHLHLIRKTGDELYSFLSELKKEGLNGIEGYYTDYTFKMQDKYQKMASELGLLISGGTDFHGEMKPHIMIGKGLGNLKIPYSVLSNIRA